MQEQMKNIVRNILAVIGIVAIIFGITAYIYIAATEDAEKHRKITNSQLENIERRLSILEKKW